MALPSLLQEKEVSFVLELIGLLSTQSFQFKCEKMMK